MDSINPMAYSNPYNTNGTELITIYPAGSSVGVQVPLSTIITNPVENLGLTAGSVLFASATGGITQNNPGIYFDAVNNQLLVGSTTTPIATSGVPFQGLASNTAALQSNVQNSSATGSASSDHVCTADNGTNTTNYVDMGLNSSGYNDSGYTSGGANDSYLMAIGGNLVINAGTSGKIVGIYVGGTLAANLVASFYPAASGGAQIVGSTNASNVTAGNIGEVISSLVANASAVSVASSGSTYNVTSISLTAGDWDVEGNVNFKLASATVLPTSVWSVGIGTASATIPSDGSEIQDGGWTLTTTTSLLGDSIPRKRINVSTTTTVYLCATAAFTAGTVGVYGSITARRVR